MSAFWLSVTIIGLLVSAWFIYQVGWDAGAVYLVFPFMSGVMFVMRKFMQKRINRNNKH